MGDIYMYKRFSNSRKNRRNIGLKANKKTKFFFMYNSPDNVYSDDLTTPKRTK